MNAGARAALRTGAGSRGDAARSTPVARAALEALAARDPHVAGLDVLLDPARLAEAVGAPADIVRVRYKPGTSAVVAFASRGRLTWAGTYRNDDKPAKVLAHAVKRGHDARRIDGLPHAVIADSLADRALAAPLRAWERAEPGAPGRAEARRHNPQRRLLLQSAGRVVKVAAGGTPEGVRAQRRLAALGAPVLAPDVIVDGVWATALWGEGDLAARPSAASAAAAGAALAEIHRVAAVHRLPDPPRVTVDRSAAAAAELLATLLPALARRAGRLARLDAPTGPRVLLHGDFTADQVLTGDGIRLIDFDRSAIGDPARDLGCFAAGELLRGGGLAAAMLDGYRTAGGTVDGGAMRQWTVRSLLLGAAEPFRRAEPEWPSRVERAIGLAEEIVGGAR